MGCRDGSLIEDLRLIPYATAVGFQHVFVIEVDDCTAVAGKYNLKRDRFGFLLLTYEQIDHIIC